jgi:hypothetical protein
MKFESKEEEYHVLVLNTMTNNPQEEKEAEEKLAIFEKENLELVEEIRARRFYE